MQFKKSMEIKNISQNSFGRKITQFTELPDLKCVMCGIPLLKMSEVDSFVRRVCGQNASMPSEKSISRYLDTMYFQKSGKMGLISMMEDYAKKYPDKSFGEIFALPEVLEGHLQKAHAYYNKSFEINRPLFEAMEKDLSLTSQQRLKLDELHKKAVNISIGNHSDRVKRYLIMKNYFEFQNEVSTEQFLRMIEYAKKIPLFPGSSDLQLAHMAGKTDSHIMQGLLSPVTPMKKRINPNDGHGVFVCQPCATEAGFVPFESLFHLFPNMFANIQAQLNMIISSLAKGHLRGHGDYPKVLQRLVYEATNGEKMLNLERYASQKKQIVRRASIPLSPQETERKMQEKLQRHENILMRETPDKIKGYLIVAEKRKRELLQNGAAEEQIKKQNDYITFLRRIYISLLRRDKLI